jgi:hypothetical protein
MERSEKNDLAKNPCFSVLDFELPLSQWVLIFKQLAKIAQIPIIAQIRRLKKGC